MNANIVLCRNRVTIEDTDVGQFESFELQANSRTLGNTAVLTLPLYAIGTSQVGEARSRMRNIFEPNVIKPCAEVKVYCWYEGYEELLVFSGFIEHVSEGFPTKLYLQDGSFILRFGEVQKQWSGQDTLQTVINDCIPVAQAGFEKERERMGFTRPIAKLTYSLENRNVQAVTTSLSFRNFTGRTPFDTIQKLMQLLVLYGGVSNEHNVYVGAGVTENTRPIIALDTRYNVMERDIVPVDGRFVDFDVKITGILKNGKQYTATAGYGTSKSKERRSEFERAHGENVRGYTTLDTVEAIEAYADKQLASLKQERNKGRLQLALYPKVEILDSVQYYDSLFPELNAMYYVLGYEFRANDRGYYQQLSVTDQVFML